MGSDKQSKGHISHNFLIAISTASWYVTSSKNAVAMQELVQQIREMATTKTQDEQGIIGPTPIVVLAVMVTFLQFLAGVLLCAPVVLFSSYFNGTHNRTLPRYAKTKTTEQSSSSSPADATIETKPLWSYLLVGSLHFIGCLCTNLSFGYGSASLVQVVKLLEPIETLLLTVIVNQLLLGRSHGVTLPKTLSVLVIVTGTSMVLAQKSMKPNVVSVMMAVGSGFAMASRNVAEKSSTITTTSSSSTSRSTLSLSQQPDQGKKTSNWMDAASAGNHKFFIITSIALLPALLLAATNIALAKDGYNTGFRLLSYILSSESGWEAVIFHALFNVSSVMVLSLVSAPTHSLLNVGKRIANVLVAAVAFSVPLEGNGIIGLCVAAMGGILYKTSGLDLKTTLRVLMAVGVLIAGTQVVIYFKELESAVSTSVLLGAEASK